LGDKPLLFQEVLSQKCIYISISIRYSANTVTFII
jgi:hypothetical protein